MLIAQSFLFTLAIISPLRRIPHRISSLAQLRILSKFETPKSSMSRPVVLVPSNDLSTEISTMKEQHVKMANLPSNLPTSPRYSQKRSLSSSPTCPRQNDSNKKPKRSSQAQEKVTFDTPAPRNKAKFTNAKFSPKNYVSIANPRKPGIDGLTAAQVLKKNNVAATNGPSNPQPTLDPINKTTKSPFTDPIANGKTALVNNTTPTGTKVSKKQEVTTSGTKIVNVVKFSTPKIQGKTEANSNEAKKSNITKGSNPGMQERTGKEKSKVKKADVISTMTGVLPKQKINVSEGFAFNKDAKVNDRFHKNEVSPKEKPKIPISSPNPQSKVTNTFDKAELHLQKPKIYTPSSIKTKTESISAPFTGLTDLLISKSEIEGDSGSSDSDDTSDGHSEDAPRPRRRTLLEIVNSVSERKSSEDEQQKPTPPAKAATKVTKYSPLKHVPLSSSEDESGSDNEQEESPTPTRARVKPTRNTQPLRSSSQINLSIFENGQEQRALNDNAKPVPIPSFETGEIKDISRESKSKCQSLVTQAPNTAPERNKQNPPDVDVHSSFSPRVSKKANINPSASKDNTAIFQAEIPRWFPLKVKNILISPSYPDMLTPKVLLLIPHLMLINTNMHRRSKSSTIIAPGSKEFVTADGNGSTMPRRSSHN